MTLATLWINLKTLSTMDKSILFSERSHLKVYMLYDSMYATLWKSYNYGEKYKTLVARGWKRGVSTTKRYP